MIKTTDIFAQTIYEVDYPDFDRIQSTLIDYISTNFNSEFVNEYHHHDHPIRMGALSIIYDSHKFLKEGKELEDENLKSIFNWMTEHGKKYWEILNLSEHLSPHILQLWATAVRRGGFVASHNHNPVLS